MEDTVSNDLHQYGPNKRPISMSNNFGVSNAFNWEQETNHLGNSFGTHFHPASAGVTNYLLNSHLNGPVTEISALNSYQETMVQSGNDAFTGSQYHQQELFTSTGGNVPENAGFQYIPGIPQNTTTFCYLALLSLPRLSLQLK